MSIPEQNLHTYGMLADTNGLPQLKGQRLNWAYGCKAVSLCLTDY